MSKEQMVNDFVQAVKDAEAQILSDKGGQLYDGAFSEGVASVPPVVGDDPDEQAKIDAAVAQAVQPLNDQIASLEAEKAQLKSDDDADKQMIADVTAQLEALKTEHDALITKEGQESALIESLRQSKSILENVLAQLSQLPG